MEIHSSNYSARAESIVERAKKSGVASFFKNSSSRDKLDISLEDLCALIGVGARIINLNDSYKSEEFSYKHEVEYEYFRFIAFSEELISPVIMQAHR
ncbi:hypothetical protein J4449_01530 [Candidatus Woesearchaeota archaeon]|nr:hypothetical protein [Candidatus Woesearchaeota archaeon]